MVDKISTQVIKLSEWRDIKASRALGNTVSSPNSSDDQHLQQIAQDIFDRMTQAATALVRKNSSENVQKLEQAANSLLRREMSLEDKFAILGYLCSLSPKRSELIHSGNDWMDQNQQVKLHIFNQLLDLRRQLKSLSSPD
jgi:gamma-glutamylcysteine synthetase